MTRLRPNVARRLLTLILAAAAAGCAADPAPPAAGTSAPDMAGSDAPNFSLRDARGDAAGAEVSLQRLTRAGPVVVIFNMGVGCSACVGELLAFANRFQELRAAGIQVVAINGEDPAATREYLRTAPPIPFPILHDPDNATARAYGLVAADGGVGERTFFIDGTRRIRISYRPDQPGGEIDRLLATRSRRG